MIRLDHIAVAAQDLDRGAEAAEAALGVRFAPGGAHAAMGTHNRLLSLGPAEYLEIIAIDPAAPPPGRPRWFGLDEFGGPPRPRAWVLACDSLEAALALAPAGTGVPMDFARGDLRWRMAVPADGWLPFAGLFPALIEWQGGGHPAARLPDRGLRLVGVELTHPQPAALEAALAPLFADPRVSFAEGPPGLAVRFDTPWGPRVLR